MKVEKYTGLSSSQVEESRKKYGENIIYEDPPETFWDKFKGAFDDPMIKLLLVIAAIMLVMFFFGYSDVWEPIGIAIAILLVTSISAMTEMSSDKEFTKLKNETKHETCAVYRNGEVIVLDTTELVVGDLVILQSGNKIPADGILLDGELRVDNSALNGETEECKKTTAPEGFKIPDSITGDTFVDKHSLFKGTTIFNGDGILEVQRVGMATMMGKMAEDMKDEEVDSPLKVKLAKLAGQISKFGYIGAIVIALAYLIHFVIVAGGVAPWIATGWPLVFKSVLEAVTLAIVIVVCAVPEGLPLMIALVLMQNSSKMLHHNVLVRKPVGIETAGSLNILFSDKTGTITKGKLEVVEFITGTGQVIGIDGLKSATSIKELIDIAIGKNTSAMFDAEHNVIGGNSTDQALMHFLGESVYQSMASDTELKVTSQQGFNSSNKFSQSYIKSTGKTFYKGAPERLLAKATKFLNVDGSVAKLDMENVDSAIDALATKAMRVLAFGYSEKPLTEDNINDDIVILGFVGIRDDVREEAKDAIAEVQGAGIQVVMITGDRKETAVAIATEAGLLHENEIALTSEELNKMSDAEVKAKIKDIRVIARALPTDKSRMVRLCQELNLVTGMTGDGVNDSPALKRADVGFAMGSGTAVAKEAGEIVILDDNFKSIKDAVLYGRTIYNNILKFCKFQLTINVAAVLVSAIAPFLGIEEPLKVTHLLFINLICDALGSLMLGNEPALEKYMKEPPKRRDQSIVSPKMMTQIVCMGVIFTVFSFVYLLVPFFRGFFESDAQFMTGYFALFVLMSIMNGFNVRDEKYKILAGLKENTQFVKVWLMIFAAVIVITLIGGEMFACKPFGITGWIVVFIFSFLVIPCDMIRKLFVKES